MKKLISPNELFPNVSSCSKVNSILFSSIHSLPTARCDFVWCADRSVRCELSLFDQSNCILDPVTHFLIDSCTASVCWDKLRWSCSHGCFERNSPYFISRIALCSSKNGPWRWTGYVFLRFFRLALFSRDTFARDCSCCLSSPALLKAITFWN